MGWSIGFDSHWNRDIGYGVPAVCDHPECNEEIDRGLSYVCGGEPYGGEKGCGLYFCLTHQTGAFQRCERCAKRRRAFTPKPDVPRWMRHKLRDGTWKRWRDENPSEVALIRLSLRNQAAAKDGRAPSARTQPVGRSAGKQKRTTPGRRLHGDVE